VNERGRRIVDAARSGFHDATTATGTLEDHRTIAGRPVRLRFAGPALSTSFAAALGHHPTAHVPGRAPTVSLWDAATTGVPLDVPRPAEPDDGREHRTEYHDGHVEVQWVKDTVTIVDHDAGEAWWYAPDAATLEWFEVAGPLRYWIASWAHSEGCVFTHAAAVGDVRGAVLLVGMSGSGKSTASLACVGTGLRFLGDDYVVAEPGDPPMVHNVYGTAKLVPGGDTRVPALHAEFAAGDTSPGRKLVVTVAEQHPESIALTLPLRALLVCRITGGRTTLVPIAPSHALLGVAPSTLLQLPKAIGADALARMRDVVRAIPAYRLELGDDSAEVPEVIAGLLSCGAPRG
jgi:hypothetical protein